MTLKLNKIFASLLVVGCMFYASAAYSVNYKVVAIVNGESISNIQLKDRVDIIINSTGLRKNLATRKKVAGQAYDILINEILQAQEAKEKGVGLSEDQTKHAIHDLERRNKIPPGGFKKFIESKGLSYSATLSQIKAGILWKKTASRIFKSDIEITEEEIDNKAKEYSSKDIVRRVNISEIVIPVEYEAEDETYQKAVDIARRANAGESFEALAREYSAGRTAVKGGAVGWLLEETVMPPLDEEVRKLKNGQVGEPIRVEEMYVILKLNERFVKNPAKDRKSLREKILIERLELRAKRYVKGLRQKAFIEYRVPKNELYKYIK